MRACPGRVVRAAGRSRPRGQPHSEKVRIRREHRDAGNAETRMNTGSATGNLFSPLPGFPNNHAEIGASQGFSEKTKNPKSHH